MMENKQSILKSFQGKKIDQSVHVARWGTVNNEGSNHNIFQRYAAGSSDTVQQHSQTSQVLIQEHTYNTQQSQVHQIDTGFKKLKNNQIQMLKQLKQEYDVLRNLNIEQKPSVNKMNHKVNSSQSSVHHVDDPSEQILSSSSRQSKKRGSRKQNTSRQAQILALEKKQLEMVINNSMRKIQELLRTQFKYKKEIHELKLQVSGRQNTDIQYKSMLKTLKKTQTGHFQTIQSLKKQNQKQRYQVRQLNQKISSLEGQLMVKDQQIRRLFDQKRKSEDLIRLQKDRYFNIDIDYKKIKMQYQLLEKDKNGQINRLMRQLDYSSGNKIRDLQGKAKRYEEDIQVKDKRYNVLLNQLEDLKRKYTVQEQQLQQLRGNQPGHALQKQKIQDILTNFRDHNDGVSFQRNMDQVLQRLQQMDNNQNQHLKQQIEMLRLQLQGVKSHDRQQLQTVNIQRIEELQKNLRSQTYDKENAFTRLRRFESQYEDVVRKNAQYQRQIQEFQSVQSRLREELRSYKGRAGQTGQFNRDGKASKQTQNLQKQLQSATNKYKQQIDQLQNQLRSLRRLADEHEFKASKATTELQYRLKMEQNQHNSVVSRIVEDSDRQRREYVAFRQQYEQYTTVSERKLGERQKELEQLKKALRSTSENTSMNANNIKLEYESSLKSERQTYKMQIDQLSTQVLSLSKMNQKYLLQTNKYVLIQNELTCLRDVMRRSIHLSQGVDHLWRIKQTEYQNVNEVIRQLSQWKY